MSKVTVNVDEVLAEISAKEKEDGKFQYNRFSKKNFNKLLKAVLNDTKFKTTVAHVKKGELESVEEIEVSKVVILSSKFESSTINIYFLCSYSFLSFSSTSRHISRRAVSFEIDCSVLFLSNSLTLHPIIVFYLI